MRAFFVLAVSACPLILAQPGNQSTLPWVTPYELSIPDACTKAGFEYKLEPYRRAMLGGAAGTAWLPYYSSHPLDAVPPTITHAVMWLHGHGGNAHDYFCDGMTAGGGPNSTILHVTPWFGRSTVAIEDWLVAWNTPQLPLNMTSAPVWYGASWSHGCDSNLTVNVWPNTSTANMSAFAALDDLVGRVLEVVPAVRLIGFSSGAEALERWAFLSPQMENTGRVRVVIGDPSSYLYLTPHRPTPSCRPKWNTGELHW